MKMKTNDIRRVFYKEVQFINDSLVNFNKFSKIAPVLSE